MKKYVVAVFLMLFGVLLVLPVKAHAVDSPPANLVIVSEIMPASATSASQEFIEIYNNTDSDIDLSGWHIQYTSAAKTDWSSPSRNISLSGIILAGQYYLLATTGYLSDVSNLAYSSTLSQSGGHLRVLDGAGGLQDQVGWGNAAMPLGSPAAAPAAGNAIARLASSEGFNVSEDNSTDFAETLTPTPLADNLITLLPAPDEGEADDSGSNAADSPPVKVEYAQIQVSEILPNPASPDTDSQNEFVELYNPNQNDIDLTNYEIAASQDATYKYVIKDVIIESGGYRVFTSGSTNLSLSNSGGKVKLLAPDGSLVDETDIYPKAPDGQSWIFNDGLWIWTSSPTPGEDNIFTAAVVKAAKASRTKTPTIKTTSRKTAKKTTKTKTAKPTVPLATITQPPKTAKVHPAILASVGSGALLYALYEYKNDVANGIYQLRRHREAGADAWPALTKLSGSRAARRFRRWQNHLRTWFGARFGQ